MLLRFTDYEEMVKAEYIVALDSNLGIDRGGREEI
jgi:hypothetical protein